MPYNSLLAPADNFSETLDGKKVAIFHLKNKGIAASVTNYGGRMVNMLVADKRDNILDVIIGFDSFKGFYHSQEPFYGAIVGRYANRIANAKFSIDGIEFSLPVNNGANTLHGGPKGFHNVVWDGEQLDDSAVQLTYISQDGEQGFPGNLSVKVIYSLTSAGELKIEYEASTDKKTFINLTNHNFWNLNGNNSGTINNHELMIKASKYLLADAMLLPTAIGSVAGTPFDFTNFHKIGERVDDDNEQLKKANGYDHNFVLDKGLTLLPEHVGTAKGDVSGINMEVYTTEPGLQFYGGNFMRDGMIETFRTSFCLETQHFPDSPNQPNFPSTLLQPGETYKSTTIYKFTNG